MGGNNKIPLEIKSEENFETAESLYDEAKYHIAFSRYYYSILQLMKARLIEETEMTEEDFNDNTDISSHVFIFKNFKQRFNTSFTFDDFRELKEKRINSDYYNNEMEEDIEVVNLAQQSLSQIKKAKIK